MHMAHEWYNWYVEQLKKVWDSRELVRVTQMESLNRPDLYSFIEYTCLYGFSELLVQGVYNGFSL